MKKFNRVFRLNTILITALMLLASWAIKNNFISKSNHEIWERNFISKEKNQNNSSLKLYNQVFINPTKTKSQNPSEQTFVVKNEKNHTLELTIELSSAIKSEKDLHEKVIRSSREQQELNSYLSNLILLKETASHLKLTTPESVRMSLVKYLADALQWKENPQHTEVINLVTDFLASETPMSSNTIEQKKSLIADKIELFVNLYQVSPDRARDLMTNNTNNQNAKIFNFSYNFYLRK